jgi:hypothetical protein
MRTRLHRCVDSGPAPHSPRHRQVPGGCEINQEQYTEAAAAGARTWNFGLRATKSVSQLTSTTTADVLDEATAIKPSAAVRDACRKGPDR